MIIRDSLRDLSLPDWLRDATEESPVEFLKMVKQVTDQNKKDNVKWHCYLFEEEETKERFMKIAIGPILLDIVPLIQEKIEKQCGAKIGQYDFDDGRGVFFVEKIESTTGRCSVNTAIQIRLKKPEGEKELREEIEKAVEKLDDAFKTFNGILDRLMML